jgi:hypothetical protein
VSEKDRASSIRLKIENIICKSHAFFSGLGVEDTLRVDELLIKELQKVRNQALEDAARLVERPRCRTWTPEESAKQIRELKEEA